VSGLAFDEYRDLTTFHSQCSLTILGRCLRGRRESWQIQGVVGVERPSSEEEHPPTPPTYPNKKNQTNNEPPQSSPPPDQPLSPLTPPPPPPLVTPPQSAPTPFPLCKWVDFLSTFPHPPYFFFFFFSPPPPPPPPPPFLHFISNANLPSLR